MMSRSLKTACIAAAFFCLLSCSKQAKKPAATEGTIHFEVEPASAWTALFKRTQGWFGGDGIFAIPFSGVDSGASGDSILFLFSDTMHGEIRDTVLQPGYSMVNNSVMVLKGKEADPGAAKFRIKDKDKKPVSLFVPTTPKTEKGDYYWLGDGLVDQADSNLYIFAYRIKNTNDGTMFPFREEGGTLIAIPHNSKFPFSDQRQVDLPFPSQQQDPLSTSFGAGVLVNTSGAGVNLGDGYIYVYGVRGKAKELIAARVRPGSLEKFESWEFRSNDGWTGDLKMATGLEDSVSNELSVTPIGDDQYALVYQYGGIMPTICMQVGPTPYGPFGPRMKVWDTSKDIQGEHLFTYNAKAHPALSKPGELLVSYNVNSFKFDEQIKKMPDLYRPRFINVVFDKK